MPGSHPGAQGVNAASPGEGIGACPGRSRRLSGRSGLSNRGRGERAAEKSAEALREAVEEKEEKKEEDSDEEATARAEQKTEPGGTPKADA